MDEKGKIDFTEWELSRWGYLVRQLVWSPYLVGSFNWSRTCRTWCSCSLLLFFFFFLIHSSHCILEFRIDPSIGTELWVEEGMGEERRGAQRASPPTIPQAGPEWRVVLYHFQCQVRQSTPTERKEILLDWWSSVPGWKTFPTSLFVLEGRRRPCLPLDGSNVRRVRTPPKT